MSSLTVDQNGVPFFCDYQVKFYERIFNPHTLMIHQCTQNTSKVVCLAMSSSQTDPEQTECLHIGLFNVCAGVYEIKSYGLDLDRG